MSAYADTTPKGVAMKNRLWKQRRWLATLLSFVLAMGLGNLILPASSIATMADAATNASPSEASDTAISAQPFNALDGVDLQTTSPSFANLCSPIIGSSWHGAAGGGINSGVLRSPVTSSGGGFSSDVVDADMVKSVVPADDSTDCNAINVALKASPANSPQTFAFHGPVTANLADGDTQSASVDPGKYTEALTLPSGWDLQNIICTSGATANLPGKSAAYQMTADSIETCTFYVSKGSLLSVKDHTYTFSHNYGVEPLPAGTTLVMDLFSGATGEGLHIINLAQSVTPGINIFQPNPDTGEVILRLSKGVTFGTKSFAYTVGDEYGNTTTGQVTFTDWECETINPHFFEASSSVPSNHPAKEPKSDLRVDHNLQACYDGAVTRYPTNNVVHHTSLTIKAFEALLFVIPEIPASFDFSDETHQYGNVVSMTHSDGICLTVPFVRGEKIDKLLEDGAKLLVERLKHHFGIAGEYIAKVLLGKALEKITRGLSGSVCLNNTEFSDSVTVSPTGRITLKYNIRQRSTNNIVFDTLGYSIALVPNVKRDGSAAYSGYNSGYGTITCNAGGKQCTWTDHHATNARQTSL